MDTSRYMDKQITQLSKSQPFNFLDDDDEQEENGDHGFEFNTSRSLSKSHNKVLDETNLRGWSSMDCIDYAKFSPEKVGIFSNAALIFEIDVKMKEHADILLHSVECLSTQVSRLESRTHQLENVVHELKESTDFNQGKTDGKLREIKNILVEVQGGVQDLRDKQDIAEAQLQLAKLQMSKNNQQVEKQNATVKAGLSQEALSLVSQQSHQLLPIPGASPQLLVPSSSVTNLPPQIHPPATSVATASQLSTHLLQNQTAISSVPQQEPALVRTPERTHQQYQVPPAQQSQLIPYNHQPYQPTPHFPQNLQLPQLPQVHPASTMVNPQVPSHHSEEVPYTPSHSIFQPPGRSPPLQQYNAGSAQQIYPQLSNRNYVESNSASLLPQGLPLHGKTNIADSYCYGASPRNYGSSSIKPSQPFPSPTVLGGESNYTQLPTARILPHAIPTASNVDAGSGSGSGGSGNRRPVDDVIDNVAAMGFHRDLVRETVIKLMENGQSVDLNAVLDKLMKSG
ncbi:PREDICTED: uncharacterized protein LOC105140870 [Populus euphratica]|uniref:Uncharacterized protein LOC105140870 n=1 Tax=Populus euphratica TaxID=75702 RepID=A0AAJ6VEQ5_POPEU|nr:PREDICTED: uncharacterized protein LOC105140870 [Populus euphratica]